MAERTFGSYRGKQLPAPRIDHEHRQDGECTAKEHDLAERKLAAGGADERAHQGEQQHRDKLDRDGEGNIHSDWGRLPAISVRTLLRTTGAYGTGMRGMHSRTVSSM